MKNITYLLYMFIALFIVSCSSDSLLDEENTLIKTKASSFPVRYSAESGEILAKKNLVKTMNTQLPNTCVTSIMEYANNKVFGGNTNEGTYILYYLQTYGLNVITDGVRLSDINNFVGHFFNTTYFQSYQTAASKGNVVMTDIPSSISGSAHNILAVGYQTDGDVIYMDPEQGTWYTVGSSYFSQHYNIQLTGIR